MKIYPSLICVLEVYFSIRTGYRKRWFYKYLSLITKTDGTLKWHLNIIITRMQITTKNKWNSHWMRSTKFQCEIPIFPRLTSLQNFTWKVSYRINQLVFWSNSDSVKQTRGNRRGQNRTRVSTFEMLSKAEILLLQVLKQCRQHRTW